MGELTKLSNIGEKLERQLNDVGIVTFEELKQIENRKAWLRILGFCFQSAFLLRIC